MADLSSIIEKKDEAAKYMEKEITHICKNLPKRDPGSEGEKLACEYMAEQLKNECGCDKVNVESFDEHPMSFFGWVFFTVSFILAAIVLFFFVPIAALFLVVAGLFVCFMQIIIYKHFIDWAFPKKIGHNVYGTKKPTGEVKRRILFNGHPDAVWEMHFHYRFGCIVFESHWVFSILGSLYYIALSIAYLIKHGVTAGVASINDPIVIAALVGLVFVPVFIALYFLADYKTVVDGANDNLTGCYMGIALLKYLQDNNITFENTEIGVVNTGSEEAGIRGAEVFSKRHNKEFSDVPTVVYSFDTIHDPNQLMVNYRDLQGFLKMDEQLADLFLTSAEELGLPCKKGMVPFFGGATDTVGFRRGGMRAAGITGLNHKLEDYYHTRRDTYDNLDLEGMANCFAITTKVLERFDNGELD